jgi:hypothetical protein
MNPAQYAGSIGANSTAKKNSKIELTIANKNK